MPVSLALREAMEDVYATFSKYSLPAYTDPCLCCHSLKDDEALRAIPLREVTPSQLWGYTHSALLTWGGVDTIKHFLPRMLEITVTPDLAAGFVDLEVVFSKFRYGEWHNWDVKEQAVVKNFLHSLWNEILSDPPPEGNLPNMETWLCSLGQCEDDLSPYLDQWIGDERLSASLALSSLLLDSAVLHQEEAERDPYWDQRDAQYAQLKAWVRSPTVVWKLRHAEIRWRHDHRASSFAKARKMISEMAHQPPR